MRHLLQNWSLQNLRRPKCCVVFCVMYSVSCRRLSTTCPRRREGLRDNSLSSSFFENISSAEPLCGPRREGFESARLIQFGVSARRRFRRRIDQIRKNSVSRALALSTTIFVVSGHRRDEFEARRLTPNGGTSSTRQNREGRSYAFRCELDGLRAVQKFRPGVLPEGVVAYFVTSADRDKAGGIPVTIRHGAGKM